MSKRHLDDDNLSVIDKKQKLDTPNACQDLVAWECLAHLLSKRNFRKLSVLCSQFAEQFSGRAQVRILKCRKNCILCYTPWYECEIISFCPFCNVRNDGMKCTSIRFGFGKNNCQYYGFVWDTNSALMVSTPRSYTSCEECDSPPVWGRSGSLAEDFQVYCDVHAVQRHLPRYHRIHDYFHEKLENASPKPMSAIVSPCYRTPFQILFGKGSMGVQMFEMP